MSEMLDNFIAALENSPISNHDVSHTTICSLTDTSIMDVTRYTSALEDQSWLTGSTGNTSNVLPSVCADTATLTSNDLLSNQLLIKHEMTSLQKRMNELTQLALTNQKKISLEMSNRELSATEGKRSGEVVIDFTGQTHGDSSSWSEVHQRNMISLSDDDEAEYSSSSKDESRGAKPGIKKRAGCKSSVVSTLSKSVATSGSQFYDLYFAIRIRNPVVSSTTFQTYISGRQKVRVSEIQSHLKCIKWDDWVTMGVLVETSTRKKSVNDNDYIIWKISDLRNCQCVVKIFLFGAKCVDKHSKIIVGSAVAALNCAQMPNNANKKNYDGLALKVDNDQKIIELGFCPDFAFCKSTRKNDGRRCTNVVNKSVADVCDYHVSAAVKALSAKRGEFQSGTNARPKKFAPQPNCGVLFAGPRLPQNAAHKPASLLSVPGQVALRKKAAEVLAEAAKVEQGSDLADLLRVPSAGSRNLLKRLTPATAPAQPGPRCVGGRQFLAARDPDAAKARALAVLKKKPPADELLIVGEPGAKRQKLGEVSLGPDEMRKLLEARSSHDAELAPEEHDRQEDYFRALEAREKLEARATSLRELPCTVVSCTECAYTWHGQSELCRRRRHEVRWHKAARRFFRCRPCGRRSICYLRYPDRPCASCASTTFERTTLREDRPNLPNVELKLRGDEQSFL